MLEQIYWVAGIIVAVVSIVGLFLYAKATNSTKNRQNAKISGQNNIVNQRADIKTGESKDNQ